MTNQVMNYNFCRNVGVGGTSLIECRWVVGPVPLQGRAGQCRWVVGPVPLQGLAGQCR
jgi:hypothetical protein